MGMYAPVQLLEVQKLKFHILYYANALQCRVLCYKVSVHKRLVTTDCLAAVIVLMSFHYVLAACTCALLAATNSTTVCTVLGMLESVSCN
jgi:hypothetical protein